jgi:phosphotransferase system HPr (HPr) family protein
MSWRDKREPITVRRDVKVTNEQGLHARPAAQFVKHAKSFRSEIWLIKDDKRYSAASLIDILRANVDQNATVILEAKGSDAEEAIEQLAQLVHEFKE